MKKKIEHGRVMNGYYENKYLGRLPKVMRMDVSEDVCWITIAARVSALRAEFGRARTIFYRKNDP